VKRPLRLSPWQLVVLVFVLSLCLTPFDLPALLMPRLGARAAWWGELPALGAGLWGLGSASALSRRFHSQPFPRTVLTILGPYGGYPYLILLTALYFVSTFGCLLVYAPATQGELLPRLPVAFVAVMLAAVGTYAARSGAETVARTAEVLAPLLAAALPAIFLPLLSNTRPGRLLPLRPPRPAVWLSAPVLAATGTVRGFLLLLVLGPLTREPVPWGPLALAATLAWVLILAAVALPVAIFAAPLTKQLRFPFLAASATIAWRWLPLHSLSSITLLIWYANTFLVFSTYLCMAGTLLHAMLPRLRRDLGVLLLGTAAATIASLPLAEETFQALFILWNAAVLVLGVLVPTAMLLVVARRDPTPAAGPP
jgi:spore germination protein KB